MYIPTCGASFSFSERRHSREIVPGHWIRTWGLTLGRVRGESSPAKSPVIELLTEPQLVSTNALLHAPDQGGFGEVHAVFGLLEDDALIAIHHVIGDFQASLGWKIMHEPG